MVFSGFWYDVFLYVQDKIDLIWGTNLYLAIGARVIYLLSFFAYQLLIVDGSLKDLGRKFWIRFAIMQLILFGLALPIDFIAVGILGYSVLQSFQLLTAKSQKKRIFMKILGYLLFPIIFVAGLIGFAATLSGNVPLYEDLVSLLFSGLVFLITRRDFPDVQTVSSYLRYIKEHGWNKLDKPLKIAALVGVILAPSILIGVSYYKVYGSIDDVMLEMSDGVKLRTRIYYPDDWDESPKPVILSRTPYNIDGLMGYVQNYVGSQGYILVTQDIRGTYGSEGDFYGFLTDYRDGNETVEWIMEQDWCDGRIGSIGGSALAINQICYHPSLDNPPGQGLRTASIVVGTSEMYEYGFFMGGCLRQGLAENWLIPVSGKADAIDKALEHAEKDEYWDNVSLETNNRYQNVDVRAVHVGGWYDMFCQGTLDTFELYNQGTEYAQDHQFLVMGPWSHMLSYGHTDITYPDTDGIGVSYYQMCESLLFNEYLQDNSSIGNWNDWPRAYYYVMGDPDGAGSGDDYNHWRNASTWPVPYTAEEWYLHPDGTLSNSTPASGEKKSFLFDPRNPVRNGGGTTLSLQYIGAVDQRRVEYTEPYGDTNRSDILKFTSGTLDYPVEIIGNVTADLYITSNCTDTDFTAKLIDVFPDGREMWIAEGILKARYRDYPDFGGQTLMDGSGTTIYNLDIDMWSTAYRFVPGHKIRISISSSNYNKFAVNPNTGDPVASTHPEDCTLGEFYIANNSVCCGISGSMSSILFPRTV